MKQWFKLYHELMAAAVPGDKKRALQAYVALHVSFVRIHPFFDGNGRMARLVANLPVLKAGLPPVIIPRTQRKAYIDTLSQYHYAAGQIEKEGKLLPEPEAFKPFAAFCEQAWRASMDIVDEIHKKQQIRAGKSK